METEKVIIILYKTPSFLCVEDEDDEKSKRLKELVSVISHDDYLEFSLKRNSYTCHYVTGTSPDYFDALRIAAAAKEKFRASEKALLLYHIGGAPLTFAEDDFKGLITNSQDNKKVEPFSGGGEIIYDKIIGSGGELFPSLPLEELSDHNIFLALEALWENYFSGAKEFYVNFMQKIKE